ncbi:MAG: type II and III secretion system protein, partial [Acidobacteria bacterium]|nr:type II and III secretion system protein [Acidobacteriota bacterium]
RRVAQDTRSNLISARGRVRQMDAAAEFVQTFAHPRGEVMLQVEIFEFNHQRARELGILPPQPFRLIFLGEDASASSEPLLTFGQGRSFYGVGLPGAEARMSFSSSVVRSLRKFQLRASHGQEAKLLAGERFPVINAALTSSFFLTGDTSQQPSTAGLGFFPSIQYENLGVTITATPYLHAGRELTLKLDLALRALGGRTLNGVPVIANRQLTGQFRLRDGESYLIGGILDRSERKSRSGFPLLSRIPWVGRLFGAHSSQERVTELLILIRPRILRPAIAEQYASRAIFFGKELTGLPAAPAPPAPPTPTPGQPATPGAPGAVQPGVPTPGQLQPGQVQPGTFQPGIPQPGNRPQTVPQGVVPGNLFPQGVVPPGFPQPTQPRPNQP